MTGVYVITCIANGGTYVGQAMNINKRWNEHKRALVKRNHCNKRLQRARDKHGDDSLHFAILEFCSVEYLTKNEQFWVDYMRSHGKDLYNVGTFVDNPSRGQPCSIDTRIKIGLANKGKKHTVEAKAKMSLNRSGVKNAMYGKECSPERRANISKANKGRLAGTNNPNYGKRGYKHSPETLAKMSKARAGKPWTAAMRRARENRDPEIYAKIGFGGKKHTLEARAKIGIGSKNQHEKRRNK